MLKAIIQERTTTGINGPHFWNAEQQTSLKAICWASCEIICGSWDRALMQNVYQHILNCKYEVCELLIEVLLTYMAEMRHRMLFHNTFSWHKPALLPRTVQGWSQKIQLSQTNRSLPLKGGGSSVRPLNLPPCCWPCTPYHSLALALLFLRSFSWAIPALVQLKHYNSCPMVWWAELAHCKVTWALELQKEGPGSIAAGRCRGERKEGVGLMFLAAASY